MVLIPEEKNRKKGKRQKKRKEKKERKGTEKITFQFFENGKCESCSVPTWTQTPAPRLTANVPIT